MDLGLAGKVALITGASRGIGAAIATVLAREGCDVAVTARTRSGLDATAESVQAAGRRASVIDVDLRAPEAPAAVVARTVAELGALDVVVANAGAAKRGDFLSLTDDDWSDGFALKLTAHRRLLQAAWPTLVAARGSVVLIAGVGGRTPGAEFAVGGAVNAGIGSMGKALAERGIADGVRVNVVNPGGIATDRLVARIDALAARDGLSHAGASVRLAGDLGVASFGTPDDVGALVAFVASRRCAHLHGAMIDVDGGQTRTL